MKPKARFSILYYFFILAVMIGLQSLFFNSPGSKEIPYSDFRDSLNINRIENVIITETEIIGLFKSHDSISDAIAVKKDSVGAFKPVLKKTPWRLELQKAKEERDRQFHTVKLDDSKLLQDLQSAGVKYTGKLDTNWFSHFLKNWILPFVFIMFIWGFLFQRMGGKSGGFLSIGQNKAKIYQMDQAMKITFDDVAGVDEAKEELREMVELLRNPDRFRRLGAKIPKGALLVGPPGCGKTLLARAVAGEAGVPFFSLTGSDFVEMFVGVGAARVRDLFKDAKLKAPCIIFIDEIDAIGRSRSGAMQIGVNDERENTLNQLLSEMDGFDSSQNAIVILASTNRPEVLDRALLRPGRFDRQILVDPPDMNGRVAILKVHTKNIKLADKADLNKIASETPGFTGADLANICNEAALIASRKDKEEVETVDFQDAIERVIAGLEKKNKLINPHERKIVAYHESGHAIVGYFTPGADPIRKVSIIPRGMGALGYTIQTPLEDRFLLTKSELLGKIKGLLGGRAAEEIIFNEVSTGASNDIERVTRIVYDMLTVYGMSQKIPNVSHLKSNQNQFLGQEFTSVNRSEKLEQTIDDEVVEIIKDCYDQTKQLLTDKKDKLKKMAGLLLSKEVLSEEDVTSILS
jgi:cell division protease FtsH